MNNSAFYLTSGIISLGYTIYAGLKYYSLSGKGLITSDEAREMLRNKEIKHIIDVRTQMEYNYGHYKKAINIPISEMTKEKIKKIKQIHKLDTILIYCNTGQRARRAADMMKEFGYKNVFYIAGSHKTLL